MKQSSKRILSLLLLAFFSVEAANLFAIRQVRRKPTATKEEEAEISEEELDLPLKERLSPEEYAQFSKVLEQLKGARALHDKYQSTLQELANQRQETRKLQKELAKEQANGEEEPSEKQTERMKQLEIELAQAKVKLQKRELDVEPLIGRSQQTEEIEVETPVILPPPPGATEEELADIRRNPNKNLKALVQQIKLLKKPGAEIDTEEVARNITKAGYIIAESGITKKKMGAFGGTLSTIYNYFATIDSVIQANPNLREAPVIKNAIKATLTVVFQKEIPTFYNKKKEQQFDIWAQNYEVDIVGIQMKTTVKSVDELERQISYVDERGRDISAQAGPNLKRFAKDLAHIKGVQKLAELMLKVKYIVDRSAMEKIAKPLFSFLQALHQHLERNPNIVKNKISKKAKNKLIRATFDRKLHYQFEKRNLATIKRWYEVANIFKKVRKEEANIENLRQLPPLTVVDARGRPITANPAKHLKLLTGNINNAMSPIKDLIPLILTAEYIFKMAPNLKKNTHTALYDFMTALEKRTNINYFPLVKQAITKLLEKAYNKQWHTFITNKTKQGKIQNWYNLYTITHKMAQKARLMTLEQLEQTVRQSRVPLTEKELKPLARKATAAMTALELAKYAMQATLIVDLIPQIKKARFGRGNAGPIFGVIQAIENNTYKAHPLVQKAMREKLLRAVNRKDLHLAINKKNQGILMRIYSLYNVIPISSPGIAVPGSARVAPQSKPLSPKQIPTERQVLQAPDAPQLMKLIRHANQVFAQFGFKKKTAMFKFIQAVGRTALQYKNTPYWRNLVSAMTNLNRTLKLDPKYATQFNPTQRQQIAYVMISLGATNYSQPVQQRPAYGQAPYQQPAQRAY